MVVLDDRHQIYILRSLLAAANFAWIKAPLLVRRVTRQDCRPIAESEALKLSNVAKRVTGIVRLDSSFASVALHSRKGRVCPPLQPG